jgi:hypothetical protein
MAETKIKRSKKKQLGQFMTPLKLCNNILKFTNFKITDKILEPSFGDGNFIIVIINKLLKLYKGDTKQKLDNIFKNNLYGVELDNDLYNKTIERIENTYGYIPKEHNLINSDFLLTDFNITFNYIIGNPPFGGTINPKYDKQLEKLYGKRNGEKIKKETYSFFIIKSIEHLHTNGKLIFILSDTFLTIKTMKGIRKYLMNDGFNVVKSIKDFSDETDYPMVILGHQKREEHNYIILNNKRIELSDMLKTDNLSWNIDEKYIKYFNYKKLSEFVIGSGGMTSGKSEYFVRKIIDDNYIIEEYKFEYFDDPITLDKEIKKARNGFISDKKKQEIIEKEKNGDTIRNIKITKLDNPIKIKLPNDDYCYYNKSTSDILYHKPEYVIYWKDDGDAVYTFKNNGNWYLHGVGGKKYFKKECITWQLISQNKINARYLPEGYILDNSSPIITLKDNVDKDELYFILGWLLTDIASNILKNVINHTRNIQSKDIEKLPYPEWVDNKTKNNMINYIKYNINKKIETNTIDDDFYIKINNGYKFNL